MAWHPEGIREDSPCDHHARRRIFPRPPANFSPPGARGSGLP